MNRKSYVHQISEIGLIKQARSCAVALERRCIVVDQRCRESEGKAKIKGYMSVSDEEAHHRSCTGWEENLDLVTEWLVLCHGCYLMPTMYPLRVCILKAFELWWWWVLFQMFIMLEPTGSAHWVQITIYPCAVPKQMTSRVSFNLVAHCTQQISPHWAMLYGGTCDWFKLFTFQTPNPSPPIA